MRNGAQVGWLNSQTTSRPPGRVTRRISRRPASGSTMLRSPKEIVTASKVSSANGSRVPSPAVNGSAGLACLPTWSMPREKSHGHDDRVAVRERLARRAGAGGQVEHPLAGLRVDRVDDVLAPAPVLAEGQDVVGDVVALGDRVEHPPYVGGLLVEVCAGHPGTLGRRVGNPKPPAGVNVVTGLHFPYRSLSMP